MGNSELITEERILNAAYNIFLSQGFHGTTLQQIATEANVNKSAIHYYFRSKERLYVKVVKRILEIILDTNNIGDQNPLERLKLFLVVELYNNIAIFTIALKELYLHDWEKKLNNIKELIA